MNFKVSWWNCRLSPPSTQAKKNEPNEGFALTLRALLIDQQVDILGLCEVDASDVEYISALISGWGLNQYEVINLYKKDGNRIDDFCLIFNSGALTHTGLTSSANSRTEKGEWLKAGIFVQFVFAEEYILYIGLSHWQGRNNYPDGSLLRNRLGDALRTTVNEFIGRHDDKVLVVLCGDYNDEPFDTSIEDCLCASRDISFVRKRPNFFFNPFWACLGVVSHDEPVMETGTCMYDGVSSTSRSRTFDQIIFSSGFVTDWAFQGVGAQIINDLPVSQIGLKWSDVSDHYPILSHLVRT